MPKHGSGLNMAELVLGVLARYAFLQNQDRPVHLHVIPRYASARMFARRQFEDPDYPDHYIRADCGRWPTSSAGRWRMQDQPRRTISSPTALVSETNVCGTFPPLAPNPPEYPYSFSHNPCHNQGSTTRLV
jgi:hypothetical protein